MELRRAFDGDAQREAALDEELRLELGDRDATNYYHSEDDEDEELRTAIALSRAEAEISFSGGGARGSNPFVQHFGEDRNTRSYSASGADAPSDNPFMQHFGGLDVPAGLSQRQPQQHPQRQSLSPAIPATATSTTTVTSTVTLSAGGGGARASCLARPSSGSTSAAAPG